MKPVYPSSLAAFALILTATPSPARAEFVAHEWGTFTSVQGSDGKPLEGLQHSEEPLPSFVYGRDTGRPGYAGRFREPHPQMTKRFELPLQSGGLLAVNEKLETPVIYFYSDGPKNVSVQVRFPGGVFSEWYPNASAYSPEIGTVQSLSNGSMSWNVQLHKDRLPLPEVSPQDIWAPSRKVNSDWISAGDENEKFIFYRGLGKFSVPLEVSARDKKLHITNQSEESIPAVFFIRFDGKEGSIQEIGSVAAHSTKTANVESDKLLLEQSDYLKQVSVTLKRALVHSGLYADEAQAMVDTWSRSYFLTPGTRLLYVLPREWTDRILPLSLQPQPDHLVRTLVGRVEVLSAEEEKQLVQKIDASSSRDTDDLIERLGRFAEPKLLRVRQLSEKPEFRDKTDALLKRVQ